MSSTMTNHNLPDTAANAPEARWHAVLARDTTQDGQFVFAVVTTGVYCRPSCPARRPHRQNVRFFDDPPSAERAGFRACRRCHPKDVSAQERLAERARAWLDAHADERTTLAALASELGASPSHLQRTFSRAYGVSPRAYQAALRLDAAKDNLRRGHEVTYALHAAGYGSSSRFYEQARAELGMPPATYRRGGEGVTIAYTVVPHPTGYLLLAATEQGVCAASLGDDQAHVEHALRREFPHAVLQRDTALSNRFLAAAVAEVRGEGPGAVALDPDGTPFERQVWSALRTVPAGETRSYRDIAVQIGRPGAARAVAAACAANPVALLIPCHRVVRADGEPGGYRWGVDRKRALLAAEVRT
ncbi:MAG: bifunctional DNA-binding transcriptional regulator/O6-methylguanine-DNA methyltransferase Ada [Thermomicrobiales bacterium]|nr:bifunctional DNA-binding transcriptional regulator/O6-methylguanine-DNA methyltransferase Ada [Thermomicrobiales bacterium]